MTDRRLALLMLCLDRLGYTESDADAGPAITITPTATANSENVFQGIGSLRHSTLRMAATSGSAST